MISRKTLFIISLVIFLNLMISVSAEQSAYGPPIDKDNYLISRSKIEREVSLGEIYRDFINIKNKRSTQIKASISASDGIDKVVEFDSSGIIIDNNNQSDIGVIIKGKSVGTYQGEIIITGEVSEKIPVNITVSNDSSNPTYFVYLQTLKNEFTTKEKIEFYLEVRKMDDKDIKNLKIEYILSSKKTNQSEILGTDTLDIPGSFEIQKTYLPQKGFKEGEYLLTARIDYRNKTTILEHQITVITPFFYIKILGIPIWLLIIILLFLLLSLITYLIIRRIIEKRKKYKMEIDYKTMEKKSPTTFCLGKIAEKTIDLYYDMGRLTTHAVVAGATGGGKSIAAQVFVEEALIKNIAVVVFDPTAQWSGMLRKCEDKKMISFYPKFKLKPTDARAFPGSVKFITNARQAVNLKKYINPGQIQIFACSKLTPQEMDIFVASTIASIFKSAPDEFPTLRVLLVFDEVHRLLPKFGGSGKGFLQIERACREFRKWGYGVMLVSQVLSDFVGEIKANINTEVQMRTRDESDLNRIKTKYGEEFLQSLIKASVGVGMIVNPAYNRGRPFFSQFRPILHNTRRLSDAELEKYNHYNDIIEDIEFQIEQLEAEKVDTFDIKMELKLVKEKTMTGNFTVVDIYLEGLIPRLEKQWQNLGKKPKKREIELVDESLITASISEAQKARSDWEKTQKAPETKDEQPKKEDIKAKIVRPITFDNGIMVSSFNELKDVLPGLDKSVYRSAVNDEKNDIADWISKEIDPDFGASLKSIKEKKDLIEAINNFGKEKPKEPAKDELKDKPQEANAASSEKTQNPQKTPQK